MNFFKKITLFLVVSIGLFGFGGGVFAQANSVDTILYKDFQINEQSQSLTGEILNEKKGEFLGFNIASSSNPSSPNIYFKKEIPWKKGSFEVGISDVLSQLTIQQGRLVDNRYANGVIVVYDNLGMSPSFSNIELENISFKINSSGTGGGLEEEPDIDLSGTDTQSAPTVGVNWEASNVISIQNTKKDYTGQWQLNIASAQANMGKKEDLLILILRDKKRNKNIRLCNFEPGGMLSSFKMSFPQCSGRDTSVVPDFDADGEYEIYLATDPAGPPTSNTYQVPTLQKPVVIAPVVIEKVSPKRQGQKRYLEIESKINEDKKDDTGKPLRLVMALVDTNGKDLGILGNVPFVKGSVKLPVDLRTAPNINYKNGENYKIKIQTQSSTGLIIDRDLVLHEVNNVQFDAAPTSTGSSGLGQQYNETVAEIKQDGIVGSDCGYNINGQYKNEVRTAMCGFADFLGLLNRIIRYIFVLVLPIAAMIFAYAGYLFMTSGGDSGKRSAAKKAMTNLIVGVIIIMCAWLLIKTLLVGLGVEKGFLLYFDF